MSQTDTSERRAIELTGVTGSIPAHVERVGEGPKVVFLHGLVGLNEHWELVVERVKDKLGCTLLEVPLLDLTGADCSVQGVTDLTVDFLRREVGEPAVLIGNSFGGHVALRTALMHPELVRGLVLAGSSGLFERTLVKGAPIRPPRDWLAEKIAELFYDKSCMREDDVDRAHAALSTRRGARAMVRLSRTARRNNLGDQMGDIEQPTLLIWGKQDVVTPPSAAEGFLDLMPNAEIVWVDRCGHTPMLEAPDVFAGALLRFVSRLENDGDA
ncbi:MAG: alpha/beta hydrolase [Planctomycetota bacterium]